MPSELIKYKVDLLREVGLWDEPYKENYSQEEMLRLGTAQIEYLFLKVDKNLTQNSSSNS